GGHSPASDGARLHDLLRHRSRRGRTAPAARPSRDGRLPRAQRALQAPLAALLEREVPGEPRSRAPERVELPRGFALPLRGRARDRELLLAAARDTGHPARVVHEGAHPPRVRDAEERRAFLYRELRPAGGDGRQLAVAAAARRPPARAPSSAPRRGARRRGPRGLSGRWESRGTLSSPAPAAGSASLMRGRSAGRG